ncbi:MAG: tetratricopeptide repeat protein, partial [bacterium]
LEDYAKRLQASRELPPDQVDIEAFRSELLDSQNRDWSHPEDIGRALYFMCYLVTPESDYRLIWTWANRLVSSHQETGYLVSLLARLGMSINAAERFEQFSKIDFENFDEDLPPALIESERLDQLVRKSLQLDSAGVNNNFRAGEIFEYIDNLGESERCYARAFKLDRKREDAALALARIYTNSDRNSDAHYVLDLCIREGGSSSDLYFEAAMRAHSLSMHELQVSYLRTLLEKFLPIPWAYYYMSIGLLELKKPEEAIESIELEIEKFEGNGVHIESILAEANALLHRTQQAEEAIERGLSFALCDTEDLTNGGIASAIERLWRASRLLPSAGKLRNRLEKRMLKAGIATEEYFADLRADQKPKDLFLFHVSLLQPLDEHWVEFEGCLPDQTDWGSYIAHWGVLADDEEQAEQYAIEMQSQCYSLEAEVMDVSQDEEPLHDRPGVAFQGFRTSGDEMSGEEDDFDDDENPF